MALFVDFEVTNLSPVIGGDWEEQRFVVNYLGTHTSTMYIAVLLQ